MKKASLARRIRSDLRGRSGAVFLSALLLLAGNFCMARIPVLSGRITDGIAGAARSGDWDALQLTGPCIMLLLFYLFGNGVGILSNTTLMYVSQGMILKLRKRAEEKINRLSISYLDTHPQGDILSRVTGDIQSFSGMLDTTIPELFSQSVLLLAVAAGMILTDWRLATIYMVMLPLNFLIVKFISRKTKKLFTAQRQADSELNSALMDIMATHAAVKAYGCEAQRREKIGRLIRKNRDAFVSSRFYSGFLIPVSILMNNLAYTALCVAGGVMLLNGTLTLGTFQAFLLFGNMLQSPLQSFSTSIVNLQFGLAAAVRVYEFLDEPEEAPEPAPRSVPATAGAASGAVAFSHVAFSYHSDRPLMRDVSFTVSPGQKVAIAGPSGAGKTTLVNLLMRFYDISGGQILLDGRDIAGMSRDEVRSRFCMVLQDSWIFTGTIAENIAYGKEGAAREKIERAARLTHCDSFIAKLPDGYDTVISQESSALSSGEKQLLSIARAAMADPDILILDEATSQVDTRTEALITRAMETITENRTSFVIAHRLYTIRNADRILFMDGGDIVETGTHGELMAMNGRYAEMYRSME